MWKPISPPSEITIIEDFEDGTLSDWEYSRNGVWTADDGTNTTVIDGSWSAYKPSASGSDVGEMGDVTNHDGPLPGETYTLRFREDNNPSDNHMSFLRGMDTADPDAATGYYNLVLERDTDPDSVILKRLSGGTESTVDSVNWSLTSGTEYLLRWHMSTDTSPVHTIEIEDTSTSTVVASIATTDTAGDATAGDGIGLFAHWNWIVTVDLLAVGGSTTTEPPSETTTVVEGFEDGTLTDFSQAESPWTASSTSPIEGSFSARHPHGTGGAYLRDLSNHSTVPKPGDTVEWDWTETNGNQQMVWYMGMDSLSASNGHYELETSFSNGFVSLQHDNGSSETELNRVTWSHTLGDRYRTRISDDGAANPTIDVAIQNITQGTTPVSFSVQDANGDPRTGNGFGWFAGIGANLKVDNLTVTR